jgi:hypothetical protein
MDQDIQIKIIVSEKDYSISSEKYDDLEKSNENNENENVKSSK